MCTERRQIHFNLVVLEQEVSNIRMCQLFDVNISEW